MSQEYTELPFKIHIPDSRLDLLRQKLSLAEFPDELEDIGRDHGVPLADIKRLVERWKTGYDWRAQEAEINDSLPQFTRRIDVDGYGYLKIHYVHKKSQRANAIPLLFIHGWPGSFLEVKKIIEPLSSPESSEYPAFHVVTYSLPGFGFSEATKKKGFTVEHHAEIGHKIMLALGYKEYVTQGGDWGSIISRIVAYKYGPQHAKAWHTNSAIGGPPPSIPPYSPYDQAGLTRTAESEKHGKGYFYQQSTQPQTLGYSLADSPVGLLGWIYEKLSGWTDNYPWEDDEVLTWISIYLFSAAGPTASIRIYYNFEELSLPHGTPGRRPRVPIGISSFPKDIIVSPKSWIEHTHSPDFYIEHSSGGHFAAHERPTELVADLRTFLGKGGAAANVISGKSGYDEM